MNAPLVTVTNAQHEVEVDAKSVAELARSAIRRLRICSRGTISIILIGCGKIRALNRKFLSADRATDVLSFRYDDESAFIRLRRRHRPWPRRNVELLLRRDVARYSGGGCLAEVSPSGGTKAGPRLRREASNKTPRACPGGSMSRLTLKHSAWRRPVVGEIMVAPKQALAYARAHRISYENELGRYVVHGLLHWVGYQDKTPAQQKKMHMMEDRLLVSCGVK